MKKLNLKIVGSPYRHHSFNAKYIRKGGIDNSVYVIPGGNDDMNYRGSKDCETSSVGSGDEIDIKPPFYALAYIMKL